MSEVRVINVNVGVFEENNRIADQVRELNKESGTFLVNIMASPGAGKTSVDDCSIKRCVPDRCYGSRHRCDRRRREDEAGRRPLNPGSYRRRMRHGRDHDHAGDQRV